MRETGRVMEAWEREEREPAAQATAGWGREVRETGQVMEAWAMAAQAKEERGMEAWVTAQGWVAQGWVA